MGLTIHYTLVGKNTLTDHAVRERLRRTARLARKIGCARIGRVLRSTESDPDAPEFFDSRAGNERRLCGGPRTDGWLLEIWPGRGCETFVIGLCRRYRLARAPGNRRKPWLPHYQRAGWMLEAFCKTYYAAEHGREHFVQCHERVVRLLDLWRGGGVRLRVHDEGGFWKTRRRAALAGQIGDFRRFAEVARGRVWC
jgi:hypothetical protein